MATPTDDRRDLLTVIAYMKAAPATPHLVRFAGIAGDLLDDRGLTITRLRRIA